MFNLPAEVINALLDLNDMTEHRYGSGPLEDSYNGDKKKVRAALRLARKHCSAADVDTIQAILIG